MSLSGHVTALCQTCGNCVQMFDRSNRSHSKTLRQAFANWTIATRFCLGLLTACYVFNMPLPTSSRVHDIFTVLCNQLSHVSSCLVSEADRCQLHSTDVTTFVVSLTGSMTEAFLQLVLAYNVNNSRIDSISQITWLQRFYWNCVCFSSSSHNIKWPQHLIKKKWEWGGLKCKLACKIR